MDRSRVLVSGGSGFLGGYLLERLARRYQVYAGWRSGAPPQVGTAVRMDLSEQTSLEEVRRLAPHYVIHNAALTRPEVCEEDPDRAQAVNVEGTRRLAEAVRDSCRCFIYCSTDLVFNGSRPNWTESDAPSPLMVYGRTKLAGEQEARTVLGPRAKVARLALLYGKGQGRSAGRTFTERMLEEARAGRPVRLFRDQYRSPLYVEDAVAGLELVLARDDIPDVLHLAGPERISRFDMGVVTLDVFGLDPSLAVAVPMEEVPSNVPRPRDVSLDIRRARSQGVDPLSVRQGLLAMRSRYRSS